MASSVWRSDGWWSAWSMWSEARSWRRYTMDRMALTSNLRRVDRRRWQLWWIWVFKVVGMAEARHSEHLRLGEIEDMRLRWWIAGESSDDKGEEYCGGDFFPLVKVLVLVRLLFSLLWLLVSLLWSIVGPYSFELGLGQIDVPWMWCLSWGRVGVISVLSYGQCANKRSLHVVWFHWGAVWKRALVSLAVVYGVLSSFSGLSVACEVGRNRWLGVGLFWLMDVILDDGPVTSSVFREESGEFLSTTGHSHIM
ncbi:hypothetical protein RchiOBHm_Chr7g0195521 [Rosa chinensis]|uniref:Transmembrane protein n=1 Tax=Rosa chinensis TaxID=74649 RepID=A0A2P6P6C5_ROSCH|nr:hypothetical protein RchiOBHm_Chr7g0195521 [Rosa chinensis]